MDIVIAIGARPGYMKMWPVFRAFIERGMCPIVVATGQHHEILKQQQAILPMPIAHWLLKDQPNLHLSQLYGAIYDEAVKYLALVEPDAVFVNGDTTSAMAVATAAFHLQIPVAHVEAGLRSGDLLSPYPEEFNRIAIDALSRWMFAPTKRAVEICHAINPSGSVYMTGNTVIDSLKTVMKDLPEGHHCNPYLLLDMHRRETDGHGMDRITETVLEQAEQHGLDVIWPAHPSPKVQAVALSFVRQSKRLIMLPPQPYINFIRLMRDAELILTDSGGGVEEAITLGTPTLQLRDHTDRQEAIDTQCSWLATTRPEEVERLLKIAIPYAPRWKEWMLHYMSEKNPYGNGDAGKQSVDFFLGEFKDAN
jgi:UDP-N-acetylglucosamine 2-epimerase (non-hydrolysing)